MIGTWNTVFYMRDSLTGHGDREFDVCVTLAALRINCVHIACVEFFFFEILRARRLTWTGELMGFPFDCWGGFAWTSDVEWLLSDAASQFKGKVVRIYSAHRIQDARRPETETFESAALFGRSMEKLFSLSVAVFCVQ